MKPSVMLCYNLQGEKAAQIKLLAMRLRVRIREVAPGEYGETLAALCGMEPGTGAAPMAEPFADEMLVLANFSSAQLNDFLSAFRHARIPSVHLKAVLTDTNMRWHSQALHRELTEEHKAIRAAQPAAGQPEG